MLTPTVKDRIARRLRGCGWLVWVLGAVGLVVAVWGVVRGVWAGPYRLRFGPRSAGNFEAVRVGGEWKRAAPGLDGERVKVWVDLTRCTTGRFLRSEVWAFGWSFPAFMNDAIIPDEGPLPFPTGAACDSLLTAWLDEQTQRDPIAWPARPSRVTDEAWKRRTLRTVVDGALVGAVTFPGVLGAGLLVASGLLAWGRRRTRGWILPEGSCPACGYDLAGLGASGCPECGRGVG